MQKLSFFGQFILDNPDYLNMTTITPRITHTLTVAKYAWGYAIETTAVDEEGTVIVEFLTSLDGVLAVLVHRDRQGIWHDEMKSYPRDSEYPVGSKVYLIGRVPC